MRLASSSRRSSGVSDTDDWFGSFADRLSNQSADDPEDAPDRQTSRRSTSRRVARSAPAQPALDEGRDVFATTRPRAVSSTSPSPPVASVPSRRRSVARDSVTGASTSLAAQATNTLQRLTDTVRRGVGASADTDAAMLDTIRDTVRPAHAYTATYFVAKLFLLACLVGYTAGLDPEACPCAEDGRKYVILWGGGVVMGLCLVAVALPDVFRQNPILKAVLMVLTFVVLYSVVTYFPMLNALDCACANDWRRWVVEGVVYVVLAVFLLTLVGVVSL